MKSVFPYTLLLNSATQEVTNLLFTQAEVSSSPYSPTEPILSQFISVYILTPFLEKPF
jgi:hypothetical protein